MAGANSQPCAAAAAATASWYSASVSNSRPSISNTIAAGLRSSIIRQASSRSGAGGGAQIEAVVRGLVWRDLPTRREQPAGLRVIGWAIDRLDAEQCAGAVAEDREFAALDRAAQHGVIMAGGQPGHLQPQRAPRPPR